MLGSNPKDTLSASRIYTLRTCLYKQTSLNEGSSKMWLTFSSCDKCGEWSANDCNLKKHLWYHTIHLPGHSSDSLDITWTQGDWGLLQFSGFVWSWPYCCYMSGIPRWDFVPRYIYNVHQYFVKASFSNIPPTSGVCRSHPIINQLMKVCIIYKYHTCINWLSDYIQWRGYWGWRHLSWWKFK